MKKIIFIIFLFLVTNWLRAGVRLGEEIRVRSIGISNADYLSSTSDKNNFSELRVRFYLEGILEKGVEASVKLQSRGILASTQTYIISEGKQFENLSFFVENAFLKINDLYDLPLDLTIGKQPMKWGNGLIVNDNATGFSGINLLAYLPLGLRQEIIKFKGFEASGNLPLGEKDLDGLGTKTIWFRKGNRQEIYWFQEKDKTAWPDVYKKQFYGFRAERPLKKGIGWFLEITKQEGKKKTSSEKITYDGFAYWGKIFVERAYPLGAVRGMLGYAFSTGDDPDTSKDETFNPGFSHISEQEWGEFFIENNNPYTLTNLRILPAIGVSICPSKGLRIGGNHFTYELQQGNPLIQGNPKFLGSELDFYISCIYSKNVDFRLVWARFTPKHAIILDGSKAEKLLLELNVSF